MARHPTPRTLGALLTLGIVIWLSTPLVAQDHADSSRLPRPPGAKVVYESPQTTILTVDGTVEATTRAVSEALAAGGWLAFGDPANRPFVDPGAENVVARKGPVEARARVSSPPQASGPTTINYVISALRYDIPFPPGGTDLKLDPNKPHLEASTADSFEAVSDFYVREFQTRGWALHQPPDGAPPFAGDATSRRAFFIKEGQRPLLLFLRRDESGRTAVKVEAVSPRLLPGAEAKRSEPPPAPAAPIGREAAVHQQAEAVLADALKQVQRDIAGITPGGLPGALQRPRDAAPPKTTKSSAATSTQAAGTPADPALEAADSGGLPVPRPNSSIGHSKSLFRREAFATVPASPSGIFTWYQRELAARGWRQRGTSQASEARITAEFVAPDGPAHLTLERQGVDTRVTLVVRQEAEAKKSGLLPKPGHARILLGSVPDVASSVVIRGKTIQVPPGTGKTGRDGPSIEVPAGSHEVTVRVRDRSPFRETVTVRAGEIWGLLIAPEGALALQAY